MLRELAEHGAPEGTVVLAEAQTAGRGRLGRRWVATPGSSLLFSLLFRPPEPFLHYASRVTMVCGLALREAVAEVAGLQPALKWPNDLIVERHAGWGKLAGILSEIGAVEPAFLMVGIGLNVNVSQEQLPFLAPNATSLLAELGHPVDRVALLDAFLRRAEALYARLCVGWEPLSQWREALAWLGCSVLASSPTGEVRGVAVDVTEDGALVLRQEDGARVHFPVGDVSLRL